MQQVPEKDLIVTRMLADSLLRIIHAWGTPDMVAASLQVLKECEALQKNEDYQPRLEHDYPDYPAD